MMGKQDMMSELKSASREVYARTCDVNTRIVWGEGDVEADLVIVGEAPGAEEDRLGRPFVGQAGQLLDRELARVGLSRDQVYITNVVKCRPTTLRAGHRSNRAPNAKELAAWHDLAVREIELVSPRVVLCLGAVAASALIHPRFAMKAERGQWFDGPAGTRAMATYHPAYLLRMMGYSNDRSLLEFRQDLDQAVAAASIHDSGT